MRRTLPRPAPRAGCLAAVIATVTVSLGCLSLPMAAFAQDVPAPKPPPPVEKENDKNNADAKNADAKNADAKNKDVEILTRGPLHEAFAEQIAKDPKPLIVAAKKPPADVNEIPPEFKPEGKNVTWIPGYWFWDEERKDYIWISGVWRSIPPNRRWVPGYWQAADKGHQWVSGFWAPAAARELEYQDTPPESLDRGPTTAAPSEEHFWIPGSWNYAGDDYRWRAGYWHRYQEDWTWVPEHYVWTPRGCIFVSGYWDYSLARRGQCYAPVYFHNGVYARAGYRYRPSYLLSGASLLMHLFVHPHYGHYYFGDYYGSHYAGLHYYSAHDYYGHHRGYDPLYTYYRAHYQHHGIDYHARMGRWNDHFTKHTDRRPPRTYAAQRSYLDRHQGRGGGRSDHLVLGRSMQDAVSRPRSSERFQRVAASGAQEADRAIRRSRDLGSQRRGSEGRRTPGVPSRTGRDTQVAERGRLSLPPASTPATASGRSSGPRPADRSRDVARSRSFGSDRSRSTSPSRASSAGRYESRGAPSRSSPSRSPEAARDALRRFQAAQSRRSSRPSYSRSTRPDTSRRPSGSRSTRPSTSRGPSGRSSERSATPSRTSPRPSGGASSSSRPAAPSVRTLRGSSRGSQSFSPSRSSSRPSIRTPSSGSRSSTRRSASPSPSRSSPSRASRSSSRPSSRPSRASSSGRRSSSAAGRPSRSSSSGHTHARSSSSGRAHSHARSSGGSRSSSPSRSSSRSSRGKK